MKRSIATWRSIDNTKVMIKLKIKYQWIKSILHQKSVYSVELIEYLSFAI